MINCKLRDQVSDALDALQEVAGSAGRVHVLVEIADEEEWRQLLDHPDSRLSVRRNNRPAPTVVRWVLGGD
jgi:hypothetical protein